MPATTPPAPARESAPASNSRTPARRAPALPSAPAPTDDEILRLAPEASLSNESVGAGFKPAPTAEGTPNAASTADPESADSQPIPESLRAALDPEAFASLAPRCRPSRILATGS